WKLMSGTGSSCGPRTRESPNEWARSSSAPSPGEGRPTACAGSPTGTPRSSTRPAPPRWSVPSPRAA
ncbi:MAG: hypothetical protein AVDCRST_MAG52-3329, partial [uncultured Blastococcus sp.]